MAELYLKRTHETDTSTLGELSYSGVNLCYILEDGYNYPKIAKVSRIPNGRYEIKLRTEGRHHLDYLKKFPMEHIGMLELQGVDDFNFILIHIGNTVADTDGCLLTGKRFIFNANTNNYEVKNSTVAYIATYKKIVDLLKGEKVFINIS